MLWREPDPGHAVGFLARQRALIFARRPEEILRLHELSTACDSTACDSTACETVARFCRTIAASIVAVVVDFSIRVGVFWIEPFSELKFCMTKLLSRLLIRRGYFAQRNY